MGDRGRGDAPNSSDGIVPYWSSHMEGAESELIVPSDHSAHQNPKAIQEVRRILVLNLGHIPRERPNQGSTARHHINRGKSDSRETCGARRFGRWLLEERNHTGSRPQSRLEVAVPRFVQINSISHRLHSGLRLPTFSKNLRLNTELEIATRSGPPLPISRALIGLGDTQSYCV